MPLPFLAQLNVAPFFGMPDHPRKKKIHREPKSPESDHDCKRVLSRFVTRPGVSVVERENRQTERPPDVDDRGIAKRKMNQPQHEHQRDDDPRAHDSEMHGLLNDHAASGTETYLRRAMRRSAGVRIQYKTMAAKGATRYQTTIACQVVVQSARTVPDMLACIIA